MRTKSKIGVFSIALFFFLIMVGCSFTTANISNLKMASAIDENQNPTTVTDTFDVNSPVIYVTGSFDNVPDGTIIKSEWYYVEAEEIFIDEASLEINIISGTFSFNLSKPTNGWPIGDYEVRIFIDDVQSEIVPFKVE